MPQMSDTNGEGPMADATAAVRVLSPDGTRTGFDLRHSPVTIGRASPGHQPDVVLGPDPQRWVGRLHCILELDLGLWYATDNASVNGTLLRRDGTASPLRRREALRHGDELLILADMGPDGETSYWTLTFLDPHSTNQAPAGQPPGAASPADQGPSLRYDWVTATAYRSENGLDREITGLRPKAHQLLRYMAGRGRGEVAVACAHEELITALWGEPHEWPQARAYTRADLAGVVMAVRRRLEPDPSRPVILGTVAGFGYRLRVSADAEADHDAGQGS
jgi:DNA-binding winged helix-turn-helix (wHTH) protein